jgi:hypothetical protein
LPATTVCARRTIRGIFSTFFSHAYRLFAGDMARIQMASSKSYTTGARKLASHSPQ